MLLHVLLEQQTDQLLESARSLVGQQISIVQQSKQVSLGSSDRDQSLPARMLPGIVVNLGVLFLCFIV